MLHGSQTRRYRFDKECFLRLAVAVVILAAVTRTAFAESVELISGRIIEGDIIEQTDEYLRIDTGTQIMKVRYRMMVAGDAQRFTGGSGRADAALQRAAEPKPGREPAPALPKDINALLSEKIAPRNYRTAATEFTRDDYLGAIEKLEAGADPDVSGLVRLAKAYYYAGNTDAAVERARQALSLNSDDPDALFTLGFLLQTLGELDQALKYYQQAVMYQPGYAYGQIGDIFRGQGRCEEALAFYKEYLRLYQEDYPGKFGVYHSMGRCSTILKQYRDAIDHFWKSLEYKPGNPPVYVDLGFGYRLTGEYQKSVDAFLKAVELEPENFYAHKGLGDSYASLQQGGQAATAYMKAFDLRPQVGLVAPIIRELSDRGMYSECLDYLARAQAVEPFNPTIYQSLARFQLYLGDFKTARKSYQTAVELYKRRGDYEMAVLLQQTIYAIDTLVKN